MVPRTRPPMGTTWHQSQPPPYTRIVREEEAEEVAVEDLQDIIDSVIKRRANPSDEGRREAEARDQTLAAATLMLLSEETSPQDNRDQIKNGDDATCDTTEGGVSVEKRRMCLRSDTRKETEHRSYSNMNPPSLRTIKMSEGSRMEIMKLIFNDNGSLKNIDAFESSSRDKLGPITFPNDADECRNDKRYQMKFKHSSGNGDKVGDEIIKILQECGDIDEGTECVSELSLLLCGTEDQILHHDYTCIGMSQDEYDSMMNKEYVPSTILVSLGQDPNLYLGLQDNDVEHIR